MIGMPNSAEITDMLGRLPSDHEVERQKQSARLVLYLRPIVQSNVWAWVKCEEQVVRQIDVECRRDAQLPQHPAVVIAFEIDAVTHLRREITASTDFWKHRANDETGDLFPGVRRYAVRRGGRDQLPAERDRPALIEVVHDPRLTKHVAEAGHSGASWILGRHSVCPHDRNLCSEVQLPLRRELKRDVDAGERGVGFDPLGRSLLDAWTGGFGITVKKLNLARGMSWIVAGLVREVGAIRVGKNGARYAQSASDRSATRKIEKRLFFLRVQSAHELQKHRRHEVQLTSSPRDSSRKSPDSWSLQRG